MPVLLLLTGCALLGSTDYATLDRATLDERDPRSLRVEGTHGACDEVQSPKVEETDDTVAVTVPLDVEPGGCDSIGLPVDVAVRLDAPLGDRDVVDARTGRVLPVRGRDLCRIEAEAQERPAYFGLTEAEAERQAQADGYAVLRVVCRDGRGLDRTDDRREDRLNVSIDDGRVVSTSVY